MANAGNTAGNHADDTVGQAANGARTPAVDERSKPLKILMVATEAVPFAKEGGVADVMGSLPREVAALGHDVTLFLPRYGGIDAERWGVQRTGLVLTVPIGGHGFLVRILRATLPDSSVAVYFLDNQEFFGRSQKLYLGQDQRDEQRRFLLFCRGMLDALPALDVQPDILHLNDWQTAPCAAYLRTSYSGLVRHGTPRIVYTIHNLQYQGRWDPTILLEAGLDPARVYTPAGLEFWGDVNWMKAGINYADVITTVSRRYAEEIQTMAHGWGLDEVLFQRHPRIFGIPNGIDWTVWNPATDQEITSRYTAEDALPAKALDRAALCVKVGLRDEPGVPVVGMVSRLANQKGFDLVAAAAHEIADLPLQLVVLGSGEPEYERLLRKLSETTSNVRACFGFNNPLSHRIYAGSDFFLMPSAFEPGGLGQLIALRYGTIPIVHATGGLADTVTDVDQSEAGNGLSFTAYSPDALLDTLRRALRLYGEQDRWRALVRHAMAYDSRWSQSARAYVDLYRQVLRLPPT
jgi:starch synthase